MFFEDFFGGMPGGHSHGRGGGDVDTEALYKELGVDKNATEREIKKAWRKLAKTHHPDRGGDPEVFKKKEAAYDVLSSKEKRSLYDQGGLEAVQHGSAGGPSNFADLFGFGGRRQRESGPRKPAPIKEHFTVSLEDVFRGGERKVSVTIKVADDVDVCSRCSGRGQYMETVRRGPMIMQTQRECPRCDGRGKSYSNERNVKKNLEFFIPAGVKNGDKITLHDEGHQLPDMPKGDVIVQFKVKKHPVFKRMGADLAMAKELTLVEALCGFEFFVKSLEDQTWFKIKSKPGQVVQHGDVIKVEDHGLPQRGERRSRGNLYVRFSVVLPQSGSLSEDAKKTIMKVLSPDKVKYEMPNQDLNDVREIDTGVRVKLVGLSNRPDLNGTSGVVMEANHKPGAHAVQLETGQVVSVPEKMLEILSESTEFKTGMRVKLVGLSNNKELNGAMGKIMTMNVKPGAHAVRLDNGKVVSVLQHLLEPQEDKNAKKETTKPKQGDTIEELVGEVIDMEKEVHTSAGVGHHDDEDDDEQGEGVGCRQM